MKLNPYLTFNGCAEEATAFYYGVFNGTVNNLTRYSDCTCLPNIPDEYKQKILHLCFTIGETTIGISDTPPDAPADFGHLGHALTLYCDSMEQIDTIFDSLKEGGEVKCPLSKVFFAERYGEIIDRFGVLWYLIAGMEE